MQKPERGTAVSWWYMVGKGLQRDGGLGDEPEVVSRRPALPMRGLEELHHGGDEVAAINARHGVHHGDAQRVGGGQHQVAGVLVLAMHEGSVLRRVRASKEGLP